MSQQINYFDPPITPKDTLFKTYFNPKLVLVMDEVLHDLNSYTVIFQDLLDIMKYAFEIDEVRHKTIKIKFRKNAKKTTEIEIRHLLSNLVLWKPFIEIDKVDLLDESFIFDFTDFNIGKLQKYMNNMILKNHDGDFASKNSAINDICHSITNISHAFCLLMGLGVSLYDIHQIELRNPKAGEIMHGTIDVTKEPDEIERELAKRTSDLIDIITHDTVMNDMRPLFASGSGIKPAQFKELMVKIGFKADLSGNTIPIMINSSFLMDGLNKPSSYFINAMSGRKASLLSKISISRPGAFAKKLSQAVTSVGYLRNDNESCDTITTIHYTINDDQFLKMLNGRWYYDTRGNLTQLNYDTDKDLIGKTIEFRSPITCSSDDGVCKCCYGHLFETNRSMFSPGVLASLKLTEKLSQGVLSAKHSQTTHSNPISFNDDFNDVFETVSTDITLRDDSNIDDALYIRMDHVQTEELDDSEFYFVEEFDVIDDTKKVLYHIAENNGAKLYLSETLVSRYKSAKSKKLSDSCIIALDDIDDDENLFTIEVKNQELTDPIKIFEGILNRKDHMGCRTISDLCQKFAESLISLGTTYDLVHMEMVIRSIIRKKSNILEYPDFSAAGNPYDWQIIRLNDALYYNPSALVSMPYGYLRKQLLSTELYEKSAPSHLDALFISDLAHYLPEE